MAMNSIYKIEWTMPMVLVRRNERRISQIRLSLQLYKQSVGTTSSYIPMCRTATVLAWESPARPFGIVKPTRRGGGFHHELPPTSGEKRGRFLLTHFASK